MEAMDSADIVQHVKESIARDPRAAYVLITRLAKMWGECARNLHMSPEEIDAAHETIDTELSFVPEPIRLISKTHYSACVTTRSRLPGDRAAALAAVVCHAASAAGVITIRGTPLHAS